MSQDSVMSRQLGGKHRGVLSNDLENHKVHLNKCVRWKISETETKGSTVTLGNGEGSGAKQLLPQHSPVQRAFLDLG